MTEEQTGTLVAQDHGHHPSVLQAAGFSTEHSAQSRSIGYEEEMSPTLRAGVVPATMMFDNHAQDSRYEGPLENSPTVTARYGTGGNNQPLVTEPEPMTLKIRCGHGPGGRGPLIQKDKSATLGTNNDQALFQPVEKPVENPQGFDRYNGQPTGDVTQTLVAAGTDNVPMVYGEEKPKAYGIAKEAFSSGEKAAFNFSVKEEISPTIQATGPGAVAKPEIRAFGVSSKSSKGMLSDNPKAGFYEAETSRTLDQSGGNPTCNQGGICVVAPVEPDRATYDVRFTSEGTSNARGHCYPSDISRCLDTGGENPDSNHGGIAVVEKEKTYALQGSMIGRAEENGPQGDGINEDVSFTLNTVDRHAVAAPVEDADATYCATTGSFMQVDREISPPIMARDYKDPSIVNDTPNNEPVYIVRRLTPVECARLQGFPDWWCSDLAIKDPDDEELALWAEVWETWRKLTNPNGKPKTEKQLRKWLANPYTDAAEYKLWGNGCCLPIVFFVLSGIAWAANKETA